GQDVQGRGAEALAHGRTQRQGVERLPAHRQLRRGVVAVVAVVVVAGRQRDLDGIPHRQQQLGERSLHAAAAGGRVAGGADDLAGGLQGVVDVGVLVVAELDAEGDAGGAAAHLPQVDAGGGVHLFHPEHGIAVDGRDHRVEDVAAVRERVVDVVRTIGDQLLGDAADHVVAAELVVLRLGRTHAEVEVEVADAAFGAEQQVVGVVVDEGVAVTQGGEAVGEEVRHVRIVAGIREADRRVDRKSTRLNSSHVKISYAVFCLKKKKKEKTNAINNTHIE